MNLEDIKHNWSEITNIVRQKTLSIGRNPDDIKIVSVSKTHPAEVVKCGLEAGIRIFGENYAQELIEKHDFFQNSEVQPEWHFIGHLQTNKVKYIAPYISMIHSVDSVHLAEEIGKQALRNNRTIDILLQVNTSDEDSKSGCEPEGIFSLYESAKKIEGIEIKGLMTIGSFSYDENIFRAEFKLLTELLKELNIRFPEASLKELSMGMSGDFETAIEEGATFVRIGSAIFGARSYTN